MSGHPMGSIITLTCADGTSIPAYVAAPAATPRGGLVLLQEIFEEILCSSDQDLVSLDNTLSRFANLFLEKYIKDKISVLFEALSIVRKLIF